MANAALGMKGSNYYVFTGGPNAPGSGVTADVYDYGAAIGPFGEVRPLYQVQKDFGLFMAERPWLADAEREHDCRVALDFESVRADNYWKARGPASFSPPEAYDFLRKGVLTTAFCASLSPALCDLGSDDWLGDTRTPVVVVCAGSLARAKQERVVRFLRQGGRALITPVLPTMDENLEPCTVLSDFLGKPAVERNPNQAVRVTVGGVVNVWSNGDVFLSQPPAGAQVAGVDEISGKALAWKLATAGGGTALFLGLRWYHAKREHEQMLKALLVELGLEQKVMCSNPNTWTSLRTSGQKSMLFILNLLSSPMEAHIECKPAWSDALLDAGQHELEGVTVKVVEMG
jgi:beta-galactosidase